jgi:hypothetical protein
VEGIRPPHPETDIEMAFAASESAGLAVTYHPVGFGCRDAQPGWFHVHCPRVAMTLCALMPSRWTGLQRASSSGGSPA